MAIVTTMVQGAPNVQRVVKAVSRVDPTAGVIALVLSRPLTNAEFKEFGAIMKRVAGEFSDV